MMTHGSLFSGIGGFEYAAHLMGWENAFHCEINPFGRQVLEYYWPNSKNDADITKSDFTVWRGRIDVLTGGFPCQPYSLAGLRKGTEDERHLWPEMLRAIREIKPPWVVGENVFGLINWNGGLVFEQVQADLEAEGYEVQPYVLPAASVGAPHKRDRVWFVAHRTDSRAESLRKQENGIHGSFNATHADCERTYRRSTDGNIKTENKQEWGEMVCKATGYGTQRTATHPPKSDKQRNRICASGTQGAVGGCDRISHAAHAGHTRLQGGEIIGSAGICRQERHKQPTGRICPDWDEFPTQPPVCGGNDGFSTGLLRQRIREDSMGVISEKEIDKIFSKAASEWRNESIKALGNAIVPQVVMQIFKAIEAYEKTK